MKASHCVPPKARRKAARIRANNSPTTTGFVKVMVSARVEAGDDFGFLIPRRHHENRRGRPVPKPPKKVFAVHVGQEQVEQDQLRPRRLIFPQAHLHPKKQSRGYSRRISARGSGCWASSFHRPPEGFEVLVFRMLTCESTFAHRPKALGGRWHYGISFYPLSATRLPKHNSPAADAVRLYFQAKASDITDW